MPPDGFQPSFRCHAGKPIRPLEPTQMTCAAFALRPYRLLLRYKAQLFRQEAQADGIGGSDWSSARKGSDRHHAFKFDRWQDLFLKSRYPSIGHVSVGSVIAFKCTGSDGECAGAAIVPVLLKTAVAMTARCVRVVQNRRFFPTSTILAREMAVALPLHPS
jgi:hypothetical protein